MWLQNISLKIDDGLETDCELDIPNSSYCVVRYIGPRPHLYIETVNLESTLQFMESAFHPSSVHCLVFLLTTTKYRSLNSEIACHHYECMYYSSRLLRRPCDRKYLPR
ncbi:hypothetical protein Trydic_g1741 [Trypoxylus dichotomus]